MKATILLYFIIVLNIGISQSQILNDACKVAFQCDSFCCIDQICTDRGQCETDANKFYIGISVVAFAFLVLSIIYLIYRLRLISANMKKLNKEFEEEQLKDIFTLIKDPVELVNKEE